MPEPAFNLATIIRRPVASLLIGLVQVYRMTFSLVFGRTCRHAPTCSDYTVEALRHHGAWAGLWMALARFWRCSPWGTAGYDPVPDVPDARACWYCPWRYGDWTGATMPEDSRLR